MLHTRFLEFGCVVVAPGLVVRKETFQKCGILLITDQVLETVVHSLFLMIKGQVFWYRRRTHFALLQMLVDNGLNRSFTQVEFVTDFIGRNPSISLDHWCSICLLGTISADVMSSAALHGNVYIICLQPYDLSSGRQTLSNLFYRCPQNGDLPQLETILPHVVLIWTRPWIARLSFRTI